LPIEKRDGSFQTYLSIAPTQDIELNRHLLFMNDSTPSPISTGSSTTAGQRQHRKHRSRHHVHSSRIATREVGIQVNIQVVKKIVLSPSATDESSLIPTSPLPKKIEREFKTAETNTEPAVSRHDRSTSYESAMRLVTSSSQTLDLSDVNDRQTITALTSTKSLHDQFIEKKPRGLFVCDLSSLLSNDIDEILPS
jgi:hypothetical protein